MFIILKFFYAFKNVVGVDSSQLSRAVLYLISSYFDRITKGILLESDVPFKHEPPISLYHVPRQVSNNSKTFLILKY